MFTKDGYHKSLDSKTGDDAYILLGNGGHKKLTELLESASLGASGNSTTLSITVAGTTKSNSITVPYATKAGQWYTARTLTVGNKSQSVDGTSNVIWTLDEIGVYSKGTTDSTFVKKAGDTMTGPLIINATGSASNSPLAVGYDSAHRNINTSVADQTTMIQVIAGTGGSTNSSAIGFHNPGISSAVLEYRNTSSSTGSFNFRSDNSTWRVGIGTTSPSYKLHVIGDIYANGGWLRSSGQTGWYNESYGGGIWMNDSTYVRVYNGKYFYTTYQYYDVGNEDYTIDHVYASNDRYIRPMAFSTFTTKLLSQFGITTDTRRSKNSSNADIESVTGYVMKNKSFIDIWGFAPTATYRTTKDSPAPYGIGFTDGSDSGGIMPVGDGNALKEIRFYGANSGPTHFTFGRMNWESTSYDSDNSNSFSLYTDINGTNGDMWTSGSVAIGTSSFADKLRVYGGILRIDANSAYVRIGPQNGSWCHYESSVSHWFNTSVCVNGQLYPYSNATFDLGGSSNKWRYFYLNNRMYTDEWIQFSGGSGLYWPNSNNAAHFYPNNDTTYGTFTIRGYRNSYSGIQFGTSTNYMTIMDSQSHKGLYQESAGEWIFYYNRDSHKVGILTSSLESYKVTIQGDLAVRYNTLDNTAFKNSILVFGNHNNESYDESFTEANASWGIGFSRQWASGTITGACAGIYAVPSGNWRAGLAFRVKNNTSSSGATHDVTAMFLTPKGALLQQCNNSWLTPARVQIGRLDTTAYSDRSCIGTTDGNLHIDPYSGHSLYLNYYCNATTYFNGSSYWIDTSGQSNMSMAHLLISGSTWWSNWNWSGQGGQPSWLWGSNDGVNMYVWNPSNFNVNGAYYLLQEIQESRLPARLRAYGQNTSDHRNVDSTCLENGFYWINSGNQPGNVSDADIITVNANSSYAHQIAFKFSGGGTTGNSYDGKDLYTRIYSGGSWLPWYTIYTSGNTGWNYSNPIRYEPHTKKFICSKGYSSWDTHFYSTDGYYTDVEISFKIGQTNCYVMVGLNADPTANASYDSIDYCWYPHAGGTAEIYENGSYIGNWGSYSTGDEFTINYSGGFVRYYWNGVLKRTVARSIGNKLYADASFHNDGYVYDVWFGKKSHESVGEDNQSINALLHSGYGRGDNDAGSTWIFIDDAGGYSSNWGIRHDQPSNLLEYYGDGTRYEYYNFGNGVRYGRGYYHLSYGSSAYALTSDGGVAHIGSMSVNYANRAAYLDGHGVSPNNSHPGYGARIFYSWNSGQAYNDSAGYSNGITIGSHPGDTAYGFQIVQNMWDDRTYTRRYNGGWQEWKTLAWTSDLNNYLPLSGGTMTGDIHISHGTNENMSYNTSNPKIIFSEWGNQQVGLVYTDYDAYRSSKGLKVMDVNNDDPGNVWFEAQGNIYAPSFYTTSDINKKKNIIQFSDHIYKFTYKETNKDAYGVIAQNVEEMFREGEEGNMTVNYDSVLSYYVGLLENRVKELEEKIKLLENK